MNLFVCVYTFTHDIYTYMHAHIHTHTLQLRPGDMVMLEKGTYRGASWSCGAILAVSNVTIKGEGMGKTVIDCSGAGIHMSNRCAWLS